MGWFDILKKLTPDEMGQVRPYIKDELEEGKKRRKSVVNRYRYKLGRSPTKEELREELSKPPKPPKVKKPTISRPPGRRPKYLHPKRPSEPRGPKRQMRPMIREHPAYQRARYRLKRPPTDEELRQEISNPNIRRRYKRKPKHEPEPIPQPNQERFPLFHNIRLYLESQNIYPSVMNILAELKESDLINPEQDVIDIGEYLRRQNLDPFGHQN